MIGTMRSRGFMEFSHEGWIEHRGTLFRFPVLLSKSDAAFVATSVTNPVFTGSGSTEAESLRAVTDSLTEAVRNSRLGNGDKPRSTDASKDAKWVFVQLEPES